MSGLNEIIQWTDAEIDLELFDNAEDAFQAISDQFENDGRLPLDSILQEDKTQYLNFLRRQIEGFGEPSEDPIETGMRFLFG